MQKIFAFIAFLPKCRASNVISQLIIKQVLFSILHDALHYVLAQNNFESRCLCFTKVEGFELSVNLKQQATWQVSLNCLRGNGRKLGGYWVVDVFYRFSSKACRSTFSRSSVSNKIVLPRNKLERVFQIS